VPLAKGGTHCYDNVQLAHGRCNISKGAKVPKGQPTLFQVVPK
jgi:5-methylcytosine-specific restriction endonuclease McrA